MPSTDQNTSPAPLTMDARKFLRAINTSAQSKVVFFEGIVNKLGEEAGKNFRLVALEANSMIFEDVEANSYHHAKIAKKPHGKVEISNIQPIKIVDEQKSESFDQHCISLVESLAADDFKEAEHIYRIIENGRFRPSVIPESGWVTTKDQLAHHVPVDMEGEKYDIPAITEAFCSAISEFVEVDDNGRVIKAEFPETGEKFNIPVNEMTRRRLVAKHMKSVAESAWKSDKFSSMIRNIAGMVSSGEIKEAVKVAAKFLSEEQEFCLLDADGIKNLVEQALATKCEFNSLLAEDVAMLFYRTNLKVNHQSICEAWEKTAIKAENSEMLHNVKLLESSESFSKDYDSFLGKLFNESVSVQAARAKAYLTTLKVINSILTKMEGKEDLANQVESMIAELEEPEPATDIIMEAEQLLCSIPDTLIDRIVTLETYSEIPGDEPIQEEEPAGPVVELPMGGEEEEGEEGLPPLPESEQKDKEVVIEEMTVDQLSAELDKWKTDGHIFLAEDDGFNKYSAKMAEYIKRCDTLDAKDLKEQFESLRDVMVETGDDVVVDDDALFEDPYDSIDVGSETEINEEYGAKMDSPKGKGVAAKSGSEPGSAGKGKAASGDPKMGSPKGKGIANKSVGDADYSSGSGQKMDNQGGKGVQKKGLSDDGLPADNEDDPDAGKPSTGSAMMDRPEGKGVAESAGNPEKVQPGTGKQYKGGGWVDKLDDTLSAELKSGDQGSKTEKVSAKSKGGVAEGKLPPALEKHKFGKKSEGDEGDEGDGSDDDKPGDSGKPWEKAEDVKEWLATIHKAIGENSELMEQFAALVEGKKDSVGAAVKSLKEALRSDEAALNVLSELEDPEWIYGPYHRRPMTARFREFGMDKGTECICYDCMERTTGEPGEPCPNPDCPGFLEDAAEIEPGVRDPEMAGPGLGEAQYKKSSKGIKPIGYKKSSINEREKKDDEDLSEDVAVIVASDDSIDNVIDSVVKSLDLGSGGGAEIMGGAPEGPPEANIPDLGEAGEEEAPELPEGGEEGGEEEIEDILGGEEEGEEGEEAGEEEEKPAI